MAAGLFCVYTDGQLVRNGNILPWAPGRYERRIRDSNS